MSAASSAAPKFQGNPLKITTVKPWIRACFAQSSSNALQFLLSDGRRASLLLPTGTVIRDLQGLEACRDKIVKVSASHDGSCVAALTSDGHCWLHNCALGQSQVIGLPPSDGLPFQFNAKVKRQQLWDLQLDACAATSLVCFSWLGPTGNLISSMPFYSASTSTVSNSKRAIVWAKHEEQTVPCATILGSCVCSAAMMSLEGWIVISSTLEADTGTEAPNDSWKISISCLLFCMKDSTPEPSGSCIAVFSFPSPFNSLECTQLRQRVRTLQSSRQRPAIFAVHGGEGMIAVILNCGSPCLYFFNIESGIDKAVHPKICLPLDSASSTAQEYVCDATWLCKGWWLVLLLSTGRLLVLDRRGVPLSPCFPGAVAMASGSKENIFVTLPRETLSLSGAEWTVSAHAFQPYVAVCTGFFISVLLLPSPNTFFSSALSAMDQTSLDSTQEWAKDYAILISRASHVQSQPTCAQDAIIILSHLWCLALSNPVALEISNFDIFCKALSSSLVFLAVDDSKSLVLAHSLRAFLTAGYQATYLCPHFAVDQSQKLDFACIQVIVSALVIANKAEDAAVLLCACRKRCDDSRSMLLRPQYISCARHIMNIWNTISVQVLQVTAASEAAALQEILASEGISLSSVGSLSIDRKNEAIIARAISPSATVLESAVCFCRSGQSVAALCALINGGHVAAVVAATLRMRGVLTGSTCSAMLSSAIVGKCWRLPSVEMLPGHDVEECNEDATVEDCLAFILKTVPGAAILCVIRFAVAAGALSFCTNSDIELFCLSPSQCVDTQAEFTACPVLLRLRLSSDPSIMLGNDSKREDCQPISARACSSAFKDVLTESVDHALRGNSPPPGLELAWVLCLVAGCGAEAALLAVASVQMTKSFTVLLSFCDEVYAAAIKLQSSDFAARISNFKASVCDWINDNASSLSSLFLSSPNIELLEFSSGLSDAHLSSQMLLSQNIDKFCSDAVNVELMNLCRHIAGDHNIALNSSIKDACLFLSLRSRNTPNLTQLHVLFFWAIIESRRSALMSAYGSESGSISSKLSAAAMIKAQLLLEFSIPISHTDQCFLHLSATCSVSALENILRSGSGHSVSRVHLVYFISILCVAVRKGAIPEQRHKLRAIAQSVKSISLQACSMINSLFESELSHTHDAEFQDLENELFIQLELLKEAQLLPHDQGLMAELRASADSVLCSLTEELWVCHCALIASCCLESKTTKTIAPVVLVPHLLSSIATSAMKLPSSDDLSDLDPFVSRNLHSLDHSVKQSEDRESQKTLSPSELLGEHKKSDGTKILSPKPTTVITNIQPSEIPVEDHDAAFISSDQLLCPARKLDAHESAINAIIASSDGTLLISAGDDRSIKMWKIDSFVCVKSVLLDHAVSCLTVSLDGKYIFSGGIEIVVWTHELRRLHTILKGCLHPISSMAISSDFVLHASSCEDVIKKFSPMSDDLTLWSSTELPIFGSQSEPAPLCAHPILSSRSGNLFVGKNEEYVLRAQILPHSIALSNYVLALALSADEKVLAVGGIALTTFRVDTGSVMRSFNWKGRWITCVALSRTAHLLYSAGNDGKVHIWDCPSGACISSIQAHPSAVSAIVLSQDQQWLYSSSKDHSINEWYVPSLPGMGDISVKPFEAPSLLEELQPSDSRTREIVVFTTESSIAESERQPTSAESATLCYANTAPSIQDLQSAAVAPSMSDVLSGVRSDCSSGSDSDDDFDSNFSRINSAIERLQDSMTHNASPSALNSAENQQRTSPFVADSEITGYSPHQGDRFSRPQRLQILSKAKTILMQEHVKSAQPLPAAHFVVNLGDFDLSSEKSSTAYSSPARSPAVSLPSPSLVHGSLYMPVTSPQASPRQVQSRVNGFSASIPSKNSPSSSQSVLPQELRARARRQQEHIISNVSSTKIPRSTAVKRATSSSSTGVPATNTIPVRLLKISSPASSAQVAAAAGAPLLLPLPVQTKAERLSALAPSLVPANTSNVRLLAPRPTPAIVPPADSAPDQLAAGVAPSMLFMSPDELQQLVQSAVTSAMSSAVRPLPSYETTGVVDVQPAASVRSPTISTPPAIAQSVVPLSPQNSPPPLLSPHNSTPPLDRHDGATQSQPHPDSVALLRESRSAIVQTDGDEFPRRAPSPLAQSTRQAINDAYNFSLPPSRHVQVLSVAPGAPVAPMHAHSTGSIETRSVAVMRGQPSVATEETLSPGKVSRMLLSGHLGGFGTSAATLDRSSLARQFSTQPDPVQLVSASLSAFERKLTMLEQQAAQVEHNLGISRQNQAQAGHSVLDSINRKLSAVLDNDVKPEPPLIPSQLSSALQSK